MINESITIQEMTENISLRQKKAEKEKLREGVRRREEGERPLR